MIQKEKPSKPEKSVTVPCPIHQPRGMALRDGVIGYTVVNSQIGKAQRRVEQGWRVYTSKGLSRALGKNHIMIKVREELARYDRD